MDKTFAYLVMGLALVLLGWNNMEIWGSILRIFGGGMIGWHGYDLVTFLINGKKNNGTNN